MTFNVVIIDRDDDVVTTGMMTIEVTPSHTRRHTQRHFAKSISTDGTEGKLTRNIQVTTCAASRALSYNWQEQEGPPVDIFCISQEANDTVRWERITISLERNYNFLKL